MFGTRRTSRAHKAQRVAEDAWEHLLAAVDSAGGTARKKSHNVADGVGSSVTAAADEARRRAGAAMDAIAGRRTRTHWELVAGAVVAGLVVGWFAAAGTRKAIARSTENHPDPTLASTDRQTLGTSASPEY